MRRYVIMLATFLLASVAMADNSDLLNGNAEYENGNYDKSIECYERVLQTSESAALYYNLGNAHYKKGNLASAIYNYEKAQLLDPNNEDIKTNLDIARSKTVDDIKSIDKFFLSQWWDDVKNIESSDGWAVWSIVLFLLALGCASVYLYVKIPTARRIGFFGGIALFACSLMCIVFASSQKSKLTAHNYAIIFAPSVDAKTAPETNADKFFTLHEGTKVKVKQSIRKWIEIELEDGNTGWIPDTDARKI